MPTHEALKMVQLPTLSNKINCPNPINHACFEFSVGINVNENLNCKVILQEFTLFLKGDWSKNNIEMLPTSKD